MQIIGPTVAIATLAIGSLAGWGAAMAALDLTGSPSLVSIFAPICALLYCSARW